MKIVVVGAGIVGLATAYELAIAGHEVTVIEAQAGVGQGASGGNGAQLSYSYVQPLADPSIWRLLPKLLLQKNSPLRFSPKLSWHQWRWILEFMGACTQAQSQRATDALLKLGAHSQQRFEAMMAKFQIAPESISFQQNGKLVLYRSEGSFSLAMTQLEYQAKVGLGGQQFALRGQQAVELEPRLAGTEATITGAVHTPSECVVNCQKLCNVLWTRLTTMGIQFSMDTPIEDLPKRVATDTNRHWVLCTGAHSYDVLRSMGVYVPVYPIKGYSITLPITSGNRLSLSVTDSMRKTVFAPLTNQGGQAIRVAGFAEIVGMNLAVETGRIQALLDATNTVFPEFKVDVEAVKSLASIAAWAGLRPATPTAIPLVGRLRGLPKNVSVNIGHGALGLTLAFGTAHRLTQSICKPAEQF
jgi:D-amino-acid dehydrogenase